MDARRKESTLDAALTGVRQIGGVVEDIVDPVHRRGCTGRGRVEGPDHQVMSSSRVARDRPPRRGTRWLIQLIGREESTICARSRPKVRSRADRAFIRGPRHSRSRLRVLPPCAHSRPQGGKEQRARERIREVLDGGEADVQTEQGTLCVVEQPTRDHQRVENGREEEQDEHRQQDGPRARGRVGGRPGPGRCHRRRRRGGSRLRRGCNSCVTGLRTEPIAPPSEQAGGAGVDDHRAHDEEEQEQPAPPRAVPVRAPDPSAIAASPRRKMPFAMPAASQRRKKTRPTTVTTAAESASRQKNSRNRQSRSSMQPSETKSAVRYSAPIRSSPSRSWGHPVPGVGRGSDHRGGASGRSRR